MSSSADTQTPKGIAGNASDELKQAILDLHRNFSQREKGGFADEIMRRLKIISVDLEPMLVTNKNQAVVMTEIEVTPDMCNGWSIMHGGCTTTILDNVASLPIPILLRSEEWKYSGVSSSLSTNFYLPASIGDRLVVIATTKSGGKRSVTVHGEMWSQKGLVASCTLVKMVPSAKL